MEASANPIDFADQRKRGGHYLMQVLVLQRIVNVVEFRGCNLIFASRSLPCIANGDHLGSNAHGNLRRRLAVVDQARRCMQLRDVLL